MLRVVLFWCGLALLWCWEMGVCTQVAWGARGMQSSPWGFVEWHYCWF